MIKPDEFYMEVAQNLSQLSDDPHTKVGAVIIDPDGNMIGGGYNHFPLNIKFPTVNTGKYLDTKYPYIIHAEMDALLSLNNKSIPRTIYVTLFPCNECAKHLVDVGITEIVYKEMKYADKDYIIASKIILEKAAIEVRQI